MYKRKLNLLTYLQYLADIFSKCHCWADAKGCGRTELLQLLCAGGLRLCLYVVRKARWTVFGPSGFPDMLASEERGGVLCLFWP